MRTILPIYAIRVFVVQEFICTPSNDLTLDSLVGRLKKISLAYFDNYTPTNVENPFKEKLALVESRKE